MLTESHIKALSNSSKEIEKEIALHGSLAKKNIKIAFKEATRWLKNEVQRYAVNRLNIPKSALKKRFITNSANQSLWFGLNSVSAHRLGTPKRAPDGITVGDFHYAGGFVHDGVIYRRRGQKRLPIEKVTEDFSGQLENAFKRFRTMAVRKFYKTLNKLMKS